MALRELTPSAVVDTELSAESTNAVQNRAIKSALDGIAEDIASVRETLNAQQNAMDGMQQGTGTWSDIDDNNSSGSNEGVADWSDLGD